MDNINNRYNFIDTMKVIASFLIILMHIYTPTYSMHNFKLVQTGAMASFFFCSGFLFKESNSNTGIIKYTYKLLNKLIVPYMIIALLDCLYGYFHPEFYDAYTFYDVCKRIFITGQPYSLGHIWFLLALFYCSMAFYIIWKVLSLIKIESIKNIIVIALFIFSVYIAFYFNYDYENNINEGYILKTNSAIIAFQFYIFGFIVKKIYNYISNKNIKINHLLTTAILIIISVVLRIGAYYIEKEYLAYTNICDCRLDNYYYFIIAQYLTVISYFLISFVICNKVFAYLGSINLWIYLVHPIILWYIDEQYCRINDISPIIYGITNTKDAIIASIIVYVLSAIVAIIIDKFIKIAKS